MSDRDVLSEALALLIEIKKRACSTRLYVEPKDGMVTPSSKCLFRVEGDVEEFLNELALDHPEVAHAAGWRMTPSFSDDHRVS